jgi:hypothetical protein
MFIWAEDLIEYVKEKWNGRSVAVLKKMATSEYESLKPHHVRSRIIDAEEIHRHRDLWRRIFVTWATLGNAAGLAALVVAVLLGSSWVAEHISEWTVVLVVSVALSVMFSCVQHRRVRKMKILVRKLYLVLRRVNGDVSAHDSRRDEDSLVLAEQKRYRDELPEVVIQYRDEANKYRRLHNRLQSVIIVGSVLTSGVTTASVSFNQVRWVAVVVSAVVGLAAGFTGYFKYRERSFNLQQTADAIEREIESVGLRVGRYAGMPEPAAYMTFANVVESLRDEQNKRQQQLDQPVEVKRQE